MQPAISASHLLRGPIFTHLTYPESSKKKITAKVHIGREEYTLHIYRPLTQKHLDVLLAIVGSAKRAYETPDGGLVVEFTGHGVLKALGERHAKNHAWLWTMIRQMQSCLITVINADGRKIRFPLIASSGFTPDSSEFRTVHHAGVTADASYYHVRFSGEMMAFVGNDIHVHLPPGVLQSVVRMKSLMLKYFVWRCMTATRRRGPLGRVINQILPADASKFARCRMRRMVIENREVLKALGIQVEQRGNDEYLEWSAKAAKVFFQVPAKSKQSAFSQAYEAMLYQRTMARSVQASEPRAASEPPHPPVVAEPSKPAASAKNPKAEVHCTVSKAPEGHATAVCLPVEPSGCSTSAIGAGPQEGGLETDRNAQVCVGGSGNLLRGAGTAPKEKEERKMVGVSVVGSGVLGMAARAAEVNVNVGKEEGKMANGNHMESKTSTSAAPVTWPKSFLA